MNYDLTPTSPPLGSDVLIREGVLPGFSQRRIVLGEDGEPQAVIVREAAPLPSDRRVRITWRGPMEVRATWDSGGHTPHHGYFWYRDLLV